jgi:diamine N-acetyltransferase
MGKHAIGIVLAFVGGIVCWFILDWAEAGDWKVVAGLLTVFVILVIEVVALLVIERSEIKEQITKVGEQITDVDRRQQGIIDVHRKQTEILREQLAKDEGIRHLAHYEVVLTRDQLLEVWIDELTRLRQSYCATNYIEADRIYKTDWANAALHIQNGKKTIKEGMDIRKVFLIEDESEIATIAAHLDRQRQVGIDIHFLPRKEVADDADLKDALDSRNVPSIDFGIFDDNMVLVWMLDEGRTLCGGRVLLGEEAVKRHRDFFEKLFRKAAQYDRERFILIPIRGPATREVISHWPEYKAPYKEMDYALRSPNGWLYAFGARTTSKSYAAYYEGALVGFSILDFDGQGAAEFYVAIHPERVGGSGRRFGTRLTEETLGKGFNEHKLKKITLKVRDDLDYRVRMYEKIGFKKTGNMTKTIDGRPTNFITMDMTEDEYKDRYGAVGS